MERAGIAYAIFFKFPMRMNASITVCKDSYLLEVYRQGTLGRVELILLSTEIGITFFLECSRDHPMLHSQEKKN